MMIFKRKKPGEIQESGQHVMRGRNSSENGQHSGSADDNNPLARRFHPQDEPDTIDLQQSSRFPEIEDGDEKESLTRDLTSQSGTASRAEKKSTAGALSIITYVPETGKFYLQPGEGDEAPLLGNSPIKAPTELRPGDRIQIANTEFTLRSNDHEE